MAEFDWATNNLDVDSPQELQSQGVHLYHAPQIAPERRVVDLADGRVTQFEAEQSRPSSGLYADYEGLERYCRKVGLPLSETGGQASVLPSTTGAAGDPLAHGEAVPLTPNPGALDAEPMGEKPDPDPAGARGGDTGPAEQVGYGEGAERGDQRREYRGSQPQTRGGKAGGTQGKGGHRSGSQSGTNR